MTETEANESITRCSEIAKNMTPEERHVYWGVAELAAQGNEAALKMMQDTFGLGGSVADNYIATTAIYQSMSVPEQNKEDALVRTRCGSAPIPKQLMPKDYISPLVLKRQALSLTQKDAAALIGITQGNLSRLECSKTKPRDSMLQRVADAYGCTVDDLRG